MSTFYAQLFRPLSKKDTTDLKDNFIKYEDMFELKEKELKNLYEKFIFLNKYLEVSLSEKKSVDCLKNYGFEFLEDHSQKTTFT